MYTKRIFLIAALIIATLFTVIATPYAALAADWTAFSPESQTFDPAKAKAVILTDTNTGEVLIAQNEDEQLPPASTAKVMTALLILEAAARGDISMSDNITITEEMISSLPSDASTMSIPLVPDETISVTDLFYASMVVSDCRACNVLACYISGSPEKFAVSMTNRAKELGCTDTVFTNPSGYPDSAMYTTARALSIIMTEALKFDVFREAASCAEYSIAATNLNEARTLKSGNLLFTSPKASDDTADSYVYPYALASKTGFSTPAGQCLVSASEKDGVSLVAVVLGAENQEDDNGHMTSNRYIDTIRMFEFGFSTIEYRSTRASIAEEKVPSVLQSRSSASEQFNAAIAENTSIISAFEKLNENESETRSNIIRYSAIASGCLIVVFAIVIVLKKHKPKVSV